MRQFKKPIKRTQDLILKNKKLLEDNKKLSSDLQLEKDVRENLSRKYNKTDRELRALQAIHVNNTTTIRNVPDEFLISVEFETNKKFALCRKISVRNLYDIITNPSTINDFADCEADIFTLDLLKPVIEECKFKTKEAILKVIDKAGNRSNFNSSI